MVTAATWSDYFAIERRGHMLHSSIQMTFDTYGHLFPSLEGDHAKFAQGELQIVATRATEVAA
jgi:hypothetical protein